MLHLLGDNIFLTIILLVFATIVLLLTGLYLLWQSYKGPEARKIEKRLQALSASFDTTKQAQLLKQRMLSEVPIVERLLLDMPRAHRLDRFILQAGLDWTVSRLLLSCAGLGVASYAVIAVLASQSALLAGLAGVAMAAMPMWYMHARRGRRLLKIQQQLPDALDLLTRSLRSGHALSSGLKIISEEMSAPIGNEFAIVSDEVSFGVSLQQALANLSERLPIADLRYFVVAVLIQRESGGNLTEVLGNLSRLIRERLKFFSKVKVLSSEGRLSAWVLGVMPFALAAIMNLVNPEFMSLLWTDPIGIAIVKTMLVLMAFGILILQQIIKIRA